MKKRIISIVSVILVMLLALTLFSCGSSSKSGNAYKAEDVVVEMGPSESFDKTDNVISGTVGDGSKIIKTATVSAETKNYSKATEDLKASITSIGGHIAKSSVSENTSYRNDGGTEKRADYIIKVPSEKFDSFLSTLSKLFNVTNMTTASEDVSESYFTLQARISTLQAKREGLVSMLKNVDVNTDFTTWQKINAELTEIDTQLTIYNEQLKSLENKVAYSTVTLSVFEVKEYTETVKQGYGSQVADAFKDSFSSAAKFFKELLLMMIYVLPFLLVLACIAVIILMICISVKKKRAKINKKDKQEENK